MGGSPGRARRRWWRSSRRWPPIAPAVALTGSELVHLGGGESIPCPGAEHLHLDPTAVRLGLGTSSLALPPARVHVLRDALVSPSNRVALARDGRVVAESVTQDLLRTPPRDPAEFRAPSRRMQGTIALYRTPADGRFHTLVHHLPRAALLAHPALRRLGPITLVHDGPLAPVESWALPGLVGRQVRIVEVEPGTPLWADTVVVPGYVTRPGAGAIPSWYRRWADGAAERADGGGPRRIFIDAGEGPTAVANREALDAVLQRHDVEAVDPWRLDPSRAVGLFRDADLVVGVHGTGVSHCLFSRRAHVVELTTARTLRPELYYLCTSKGLPYDFVPAVEAPGRNRHAAPGRDGVTVDVTWLDSLLGRIAR